MKLMNYDTRTLIMQNVRVARKEPLPDTYTKSQYRILCSLIRRKHIKRQFFQFLISELYGLSDWRGLGYSQMYELIFILTHYDYEKGGVRP